MCRRRRQPRPKKQTRAQTKQRSSAECRRIRSDTTPADSARWEKCSLRLLRKWRPTKIWGMRCPNNYGAGKAGRQEKAGPVCAVTLVESKGTASLVLAQRAILPVEALRQLGY